MLYLTKIKLELLIDIDKYIFFESGVRAVSYTHLDVYKRQIQNLPILDQPTFLRKLFVLSYRESCRESVYNYISNKLIK